MDRMTDTKYEHKKSLSRKLLACDNCPYSSDTDSCGNNPCPTECADDCPACAYEAGKWDCEATHFKPWKVNIKDIQDEAYKAGQKSMIDAGYVQLTRDEAEIVLGNYNLISSIRAKLKSRLEVKDGK